MVGQKLIFEYSGYALHSGYANVYWSAIVRLGLLFPLPPRSRAKSVDSCLKLSLVYSGTKKKGPFTSPSPIKFIHKK